MARQTLTVTEVVAAGVAPAGTVGQVDGHGFLNHGETIIVITNSGVGSHTVTVQTPKTVGGLAVAELTNAIAAATTEYMGPFPPGTYNQANGQVYVDFDAVPAELSVRALRVPKA